MFIDRITSAQNPKIKDLLTLQEKSKERKQRGLFVVEGKREFEQCLQAGFVPESVFFNPELYSFTTSPLFEIIPTECHLFEVSDYLYGKIAYREETEGIIALFYERNLALEQIVLRKNPLIIVLEAIEKPGNLGAVLRTADACLADAVIICDPLTDLYNPNLIRSSLGGLFTNQVTTATSQETYEWLKKHNIRIFSAQLQDSRLYYDADFTGGSAIVLGAESTGLKSFWREVSDSKIRIPMLGKIDSLNISVSAAILCFEVLRQREVK